MNKELMFSSVSHEQYTPLDFLSKLFRFSGEIDLDPCSNSLESPQVTAKHHFTKELDGLSQHWQGKVYVNPPYGREISKWVNKAVCEYKSERSSEIYILLPSRTDTKWHKSLDKYSRCYLTGRLKFQNLANQNNSAPFPSVLFYLGDRNNEFIHYWKSFGFATVGQ